MGSRPPTMSIMLSWWPETQLEWAFFAATAAQGVINTTIQTIILVVYLQWVNPQAYEVPVSYVIPLTLSINSLGCLYQMILTLDAYRIKNHLQIFALCIANVCLTISTTLQYGEVNYAQNRGLQNYDHLGRPHVKHDWHFWRRVSPGLMVCAVVSGICSAVVCIIAIRLYREFAWALYQNISPDTSVQNKYMFYQIYLVFLKYTPYFVFSFLFVYNMIDVHFAEPEFSLTMCIIPAALLHLGLAVYFVRHEKRIAMFFILLLHAAFIAYFISRLMVLYGNTQMSRTLMKDEMVFYLVIALVASIFSIVIGFICTLNFRKGLKPILLGQIQRQQRAHELEDEYYIQRLNYNILPLPTRESQRFALD